MNTRVISLAATVLLAAAVATLVLDHAIFSKMPFGIAIQIAAALLMLWARLTFGLRSFHAGANPTQGGLVTSGPYRYWRHPIYAAVLIFVWTGVLTQGGRPALVPVLLSAVATIMTFVRILSEEKLLRATFPDYAAYSMRTKRFIPFVF
jgi:protein-S-isoprenylcysteine O-methyltransferase Ste14